VPGGMGHGVPCAAGAPGDDDGLPGQEEEPF